MGLGLGQGKEIRLWILLELRRSRSARETPWAREEFPVAGTWRPEPGPFERVVNETAVSEPVYKEVLSVESKREGEREFF